MATNQILRGIDLQCYVNGNLIGEFTDFTYTADYGRKSIYGIDGVTPFEIAPSVTRINGTVRALRIKASGGLEGRGIVARFREISKEKYITISIIDREFDMEVLKVENASINNQSWSVTAKGIVTGSFSFEGINYENEDLALLR